MKILLLSAYFPPDTGSAAHLFHDLGKCLVDRGHDVTIITSMPAYHALGNLDRYNGKKWVKENVEGMNVLRVATPQLPRRLMVGRALWQFSGAAAFFIAGLSIARRDVAMVYSPPLPLGLTAWGLRLLRGIPFILNVQDLFPQSIIDLGLLKNRWIIRLFEGMERFVYERTDAITVHSEGNRKYVTLRGAPKAKVSVIPNWIDTDSIRPAGRMNEFRKINGLGDSFVVSFAGVLGYSQDLDVALEAAALLNGRADISWLIVGDGVEKERLVAKAKKMGLGNIRFLPMQPRDRYPDVLHASDACLVTLHSDVKTPVVPSKILSIMAAGRPVVAALNLDGDAPRLINDAKCGLCVPAEDAGALADAVFKLYQDSKLTESFGATGRKYAEENLSTEAAVSSYERMIVEVSRSTSRKG